MQQKRRKALANNLWIARKRVGYPQKWVSALIGRQSFSIVSEYERGVKLPTLRTALKLACIFRMPLAELFPDLQAEAAREVAAAKEHHLPLKRCDEEAATGRARHSGPNSPSATPASQPTPVQARICPPGYGGGYSPSLPARGTSA